MYKLVIPTAGIGSRIGPYTKFKNKALVSVGLKPAIVKVSENFTDAQEIIILTGYEAESLKDVVLSFYPSLNIKFIHVENYSGEGSGLGLTLQHARDDLQCPFIFSPNDAIFEGFDFEKFKSEGNKLCYYQKADGDTYKLEQYRTIASHNGYVSKIYSKGLGTNDIYTGLCKVDDFSEFWDAMKHPGAIVAGEVVGLAALNNLQAFLAPNWLDCGTLETLSKTKQYFDDPDIHVLEKQDEAIWFMEDKVIKFSKNADFIKGRLERYNLLPESVTPKIISSSKYTYTYTKLPGSVYSPYSFPDELPNILNLMKDLLWSSFDLETPKSRLDELCMSFYRDKTFSRTSMYFEKYETIDTELVINQTNVPRLPVTLDQIDWQSFCNKSIWSNFHGDFHSENILVSEYGIKLIDWRQNFGDGHFKSGDVYYDLAKFMHGLEVNHGIISQNLFEIKWKNRNTVDIDLYTKRSLVNARNEFINWLELNNFDVNHVKLLTALIYINIAPLHEYPYSEFLHLFGRLRLTQCV